MPIYESPSVAVERDTDGSFVLKFDVPGRSVNLLTRQTLADLDGALDALAGQPRVSVLVVRSEKKSGFLAGADVEEFTQIKDAAGARALSEAGQRLFGKLAALEGPSVAVIHGPCLGGGLELALACDYRLVFDKPSTQLGFPEIELGLLPAWGGTQRLPRVIGLEPALQVILAGKRLGAREAFQRGLADAYAANEADLREQFARLVLRAVAMGKRPRRGLPLRGWRQRLLESNPFGRRLILKGTERLLRQRVPDDMPAPTEALDAVRTGISQGLDAGLVREREGAARLATSPASRNLVQLFLRREAARKPAGIENAREVRRVGVVGAGVMGAGIAQLAALQGHEVYVQEINADALAAGLARLDDLFAKAAERGRVSAEEARQKRAKVRGTVAWEGFERADLVIEAAAEDLEIKRNVFRELANRAANTAVLATNTSSLAVKLLQETTPGPERVAGLHFFNPVHKMPLVEVVQAKATSDATAALLLRFAVELGKVPVRVGDGPGFVVNRVLMPYLDEAVRLVGEGLRIKDIDRLLRRFGMPMGPLELLDQIGLDVAAHVARLVRQQLGRPAEEGGVFAKMKDAGWLGQKSGVGFYVHKGRKATPHRAAEELVRSSFSGSSISANLPEAARLAEARERLVLLTVNEAAAVLGDGLAADSDTVDLAMVMGTGWAPHRGGPLRYAEDRGVADVVRTLEQLAARHGPRFEPRPELKRRASSGEPFRPGSA
jgi:3-hydroxyacyl-CoA dehydrogenase/enoyl-CoA hydratase/3-hydroxybutyryl-CoA epimerase